jgi:phosphoacetylglucosamine mutase
MLEQSWEAYATKLANAETDTALIDVVKEIVAKNDIDETQSASVVYGRDTRWVVVLISSTRRLYRG